MTSSSTVTPVHSPRPAVRERLNAARTLFLNGKHEAARDVYAQTLRDFPGALPEETATLLSGIATSYLAQLQFGPAQKYYNEAAAAVAGHDSSAELQLGIATNRTSLYRLMGDEQAAQEVWRGIAHLGESSRNPVLIAQFANSVRGSDAHRALGLFSKALNLVDETYTDVREGFAIRATIWSSIGVIYWNRKDFEAAERAFTESYRLRLMSGKRSGMPTVYAQLGVLRRIAGDLTLSRVLLERARSMANDGMTPLAFIEYQLGRTALASGDRNEALQRFRTAVAAARAWRLQMLPAERFRISNETTWRGIYEDYVATSFQTFTATSNRSYLQEAFEAAEQSRTFLFQQAIGQQRTLPPEYWTSLSRYRTLLIRTLGSDDPALAEETETVRLRLADLEAQLGLNSPDEKNSHQTSEKKRTRSALEDLQEKLKEQEAFLSFYSGEKNTYLWAVTRTSSEVHELPGRSVLSRQVDAFRSALLARNEKAGAMGGQLAALLFGRTSSTVRRKTDWILSLDGPLFQLPFAALPEGNTWLGQGHTLRTVPGVPSRNAAITPRTSLAFSGWGDPVYNRADSRWKGKQPLQMQIELERLAGTSEEVKGCARAWKHDTQPQMAFGQAVNRTSLVAALNEGPAVMHLATHVLPHPRRADGLLIALGSSPAGEQQFLSAAEIAALKTRAGMIVLSGCGSGRGETVPGLGLFGLIRSFLVAGASTVVATFWPIPDDDGALLAEMYSRLSAHPEVDDPGVVARALQAAQAKMIADGGPRSHPAYWSAFAVSGKE